jgi:hypothetical protein
MKREIDPQSWFGTREVKGGIPKHFVRATTGMSEESYLWVVKKLYGRFGTSSIEISNFSTFSIDTYIYFEDPKEAMIYELRWSGSN